MILKFKITILISLQGNLIGAYKASTGGDMAKNNDNYNFLILFNRQHANNQHQITKVSYNGEMKILPYEPEMQKIVVEINPPAPPTPTL